MSPHPHQPPTLRPVGEMKRKLINWDGVLGCDKLGMRLIIKYKGMQYLGGYQQAYNLDKDIGLFTLYREQAEYQHALAQARQPTTTKDANHRKLRTRNSQLSSKKIARRISTLDNEKPNFLSERSMDGRLGQEIKNLPKLSELRSKTNVDSQLIFANRHHLTNRNKKIVTDSADIRVRNQIYFSPRTNITYLQASHHKDSPSQNIQTKPQPSQPQSSNKHLPKIRNNPSIKYKQKYTHNIKQDSFKISSDTPSTKPIAGLNKSAEIDDKICSTFIMISSKQYRMLSQRKEVPLLTILKKYSRNS